jgi:hypothetical protein
MITLLNSGNRRAARGSRLDAHARPTGFLPDSFRLVAENQSP